MTPVKGTGTLRIIAGQWRGRKLPVADLPGLRPSTDRIRETLFNWLAQDVVGAHCLDLFAGTGALGLEALSRGAAHCHFIERQSTAVKLLKEAITTLNAGAQSQVFQEDALQFLKRLPRETLGRPVPQETPDASSSAAGAPEPGYDLVFLDPPFDSDLLAASLKLLADSPLLARGALVYLEYAPAQCPETPGTWEQYRSKKSGGKSAGVVYELYRLPTA